MAMSFLFALLAVCGVAAQDSHALTSKHFSPLQVLPWIQLVPERHVALFYWNGALQPGVFGPGLHWYGRGLGSTSSLIFVGVDRDKVPEHGERHLSCKSRDGSNFKFMLEVANRLDPEHVWETIKTHGAEYDVVTIYNQAEPAMKEVCANMTADEIAIHKYHELDDLLREQLILKQKELKSHVEIVQVKILEMIVPPDLDASYQRQAAAKARRQALIEERSADQEQIRNEQLKADSELEIKRKADEAELHHKEKCAESENRLSVLKAEADRNVTLLKAEAEAERKKIDAKANEIWLSEKQLQLKDSENLSIFHLIARFKNAWR